MSRPVEHIGQFFRWDHLPPRLQTVSRPFGELAEWMLEHVPDHPQRDVALEAVP